MQRSKIAIIVIVFSALLVGLGVSFAFGNTINPNCPPEVMQAIQNWDNGLDERTAQNQTKNVAAEQSSAHKQSSRFAATDLRTLFLSSLITLTFNTPIHSQIQVVQSIQKLFTVAKHYLQLPSPISYLPSLVALFTVLKRFFEKVIFFLIGLILPIFVVINLTSHISHLTSVPIYYRFQNLRL